MTASRPRRRCPAVRPGPGLLALSLLVAAAACGESADSGGGAATTTTAAAATTTTTAAKAPVQHSAPRWETVTTFTGTGSETTAQFPILPDAIQWRARWTCQTGRLKVTTVPPPRRGTPVVDGACQEKPAGQDTAIGYSIVSGSVQMVVEASGPWAITVDQQIDTPLVEPPLPGMATAKVLGQGDFYDVEMKGKGTARTYQLADGSRALRLEGFEVSSNTDLFVWLSEAPSPKTSADAVAAPYVELGNLKSTIGDENYVLPADLAPEKIKSIVIWCAPVRIAYAAAVLAPPS